MKKLFTIISCLVLTATVTAQINVKKEVKKVKTTKTIAEKKVEKVASPNAPVVQQTAIPTESLSLKENEYDFGKIPQGKPVTHVFEFTNTGKTPFSLENVQASCGCTTPVWNKDEVAPGETAVITVGYNAASVGTFTKPVTIHYNGNQTKQIIIKGEVWKTPVTSAPENSSVNILKKEQ